MGEGSNQIAWWRNDGSEVFAQGTIGDSVRGASSLGAADLSGDGLLDVVAASYDGKEVFWLEQLSIETAEAVELPAWDLGASPEIVSLSASSTLADDKIPDRYAATNVFDGDPRTCWVEGREDGGLAETISVEFSPPIKVAALEVMPGFYDTRYWEANSRVASLGITVTDSMGIDHQTHAELEDAMRPQTVEIGSRDIWKVELAILSVHPGSRWNDTCLAEIAFLSRGNRVPVLTAPRVADKPPVGASVSMVSQIDQWFWDSRRDGTFTHKADMPGSRESGLFEFGTWSFADGRIELKVLYRFGRRGVGAYQKPSGESEGPSPAVGGYKEYEDFFEWGEWIRSENWEAVTKGTSKVIPGYLEH